MRTDISIADINNLNIYEKQARRNGKCRGSRRHAPWEQQPFYSHYTD